MWATCADAGGEECNREIGWPLDIGLPFCFDVCLAFVVCFLIPPFQWRFSYIFNVKKSI